jgi:hypothetical protein
MLRGAPRWRAPVSKIRVAKKVTAVVGRASEVGVPQVLEG